MGAIEFVLFLMVTGWLLNKAKANGEFGSPPTKREQDKLNSRFWCLFGPCVGGLWLAIMAGIHALDAGLYDRYFEAYLIGCGLVAVFFGAGLAAGVNGLLERTRFRVRKLRAP